jgi:hypothetical protein
MKTWPTQKSSDIRCIQEQLKRALSANARGEGLFIFDRIGLYRFRKLEDSQDFHHAQGSGKDVSGTNRLNLSSQNQRKSCSSIWEINRRLDSFRLRDRPPKGRGRGGIVMDDSKKQEIIDALYHVLIRLDNVDETQKGIMSRLTEIERRLGLITLPKLDRHSDLEVQPECQN